ncbi:MAG: SDR family NAD(P)-dependent oxidoreductase [Caldisericaceae bacterium]|nr:SDR family NAD(P)-dependent oxidoreductase [Caldisericaceae bacterium]
MGRLEKKVVIITGGSSGIGKAAVKLFLQEGAAVVNWDVNPQAADAFKNQLHFMQVNVADFDQGWGFMPEASICRLMNIL